MAKSQTDIFSTMQNGVVAINSLIQALSNVSTTSSGITTIRLTHNSSS